LKTIKKGESHEIRIRRENSIRWPCSHRLLDLLGLFRGSGNPSHDQHHSKRFTYEPDDITIKKGEPVVLELTTTDVTHGLKFKDLNLNTRVEKGKKNELAFTPTKAGDFNGQCSVFCGSGHGSMHLTLHVTE
jgi:cytochrome c oxidase subunit II